MKRIIFKLCISVILFTSSVLSKTNLKANSSSDVLGESSSDGSQTKGAISYSLGSNGGYTLKDETGYKPPTYLEKLPDKFDLPPSGPKENPEELPSVTDYYDGSTHLNAVKIQCVLYANPTECLHQSSCGWCGSNTSCILGNNLGPMQSCIKSSYIFTAPFPNWNPQVQILNEQVGGVALTVVSKQ